MSHNLSVLLLALLARAWRGEPQSVRAVVGSSWQGCGEVSYNLSVLLLVLMTMMWRDELQSVRAVVGPAGKGVVER
jgi:hypothetical protein